MCRILSRMTLKGPTDTYSASGFGGCRSRRDWCFASIFRDGKAEEKSRRRWQLSRAASCRVARTHAVATLLDGLEPREEEFGACSGRGPIGRSFPRRLDSRRSDESKRFLSLARAVTRRVYHFSAARGERVSERERDSPPDACIGASRERTTR